MQYALYILCIYDILSLSINIIFRLKAVYLKKCFYINLKKYNGSVNEINKCNRCTRINILFCYNLYIYLI